MSVLTSENWDGVVAPTIPSGWNITSGTYQATVAASGMQAGASPTSPPNVLGLLPAATTNTWFTATYEFPDGVSGNVVLNANFNFYQNTNSQVGLHARSTGITTAFGSDTFYFAWVNDPSGGGGSSNAVGISYYNGSSSSAIATITGITFTANTWYTLYFFLNGNNLELQLLRMTDSFWLNPAGVWGSLPTTAIIASDSNISGSGYFGIAMNQRAANSYLYTDDFAANSIAPSGIPRPPLIVRIPHQYYPINDMY